MRWRGPLLLWGGGIGIAVSLFLSDVPLFQKDVLRKIPAVSSLTFVGEFSDIVNLATHQYPLSIHRARFSFAESSNAQVSSYFKGWSGR
jgi:hypothetical protein